MVRIVLASQSPRRRQLVELLGYPTTSLVSGADETERLGEDPAAYVLRTARHKAEAVAGVVVRAGDERAVILAADTTVALDGAILGKPRDATEARSMLLALRGRTHEVHTGLCLVDVTRARETSSVHTARVTMRPYSDPDMDDYIATGDPFDKAGGYAIQDGVFRPVSAVEGCYLAVMGLSLCEVVAQLVTLAVPIRSSAAQMAALHNAFPCPVLESVRAHCLP